MEEQEYVAKIRSLLRQERAVEEALSVTEHGLRSHLRSPALWCLRGDLIRLSEAYADARDESLASYERAIHLDPGFAGAYEGLGAYYESVVGDYDRAETAFRKAVELGGGEESRTGLTRVRSRAARA